MHVLCACWLTMCILVYPLNIADVNECDLALGIQSCEDICTNTVGSYYCECLDGRVLVNRTHCTGKIIGTLILMC